MPTTKHIQSRHWIVPIPPDLEDGIESLLKRSHPAGLQVLYKDEWRPVPCLPNTFVVNIGNSPVCHTTWILTFSQVQIALQYPCSQQLWDAGKQRCDLAGDLLQRWTNGVFKSTLHRYAIHSSLSLLFTSD